MLKKTFFTLILLYSLGSISLLQASKLTSNPGTIDDPVVVNVTMLLLNVNEIESASQSFNANVFFQLEWQDDRLTHSGKDMQKYKLDDIWHPNMTFANETHLRRTFPRIAHVSPSGHVVFIQRVVGDFSQALNLSEFPFDTQTFEILLVSVGEYEEKKIIIKPLNDHAGDLADTFSLADWDVVNHTFEALIYQPFKLMNGDPAVSFQFTVNRKIGYYWLHAILPLVFIVIMSMLIFWVPPTQAGVQIGVSTTSMLTLVAYRFAIASSIPRVSYLTRLDTFILISTILVFFTLIHSLLTAQLVDKGRENLAIKLDRTSRFLFPLIFIFSIVYLLILPRDINNEADWSLLIPTLMGIFG
ncbi:hypothetical protein ACLHDG_01795 [Sulfurovum sp. CS9]|uniref:hypothetical protein n=1 Tax=Sulfurovum sp. CS9 TaxID=3391146 RepID=UPI0039ED2124